LHNTGASYAIVTPTITIQSESKITALPDHKHVRIGAGTTLSSPLPFQRAEQTDSKLVLLFADQTLTPRAERKLAFGFTRGDDAPDWPIEVAQAQASRRQAERFWLKADLPYGHLQVPDTGVQALLDSSIRNIYQAREIKNGLPAFQVGPTCYRGLWVVDGSFLLEAITYL
jgi:hypothetical protein